MNTQARNKLSRMAAEAERFAEAIRRDRARHRPPSVTIAPPRAAPPKPAPNA